MNASEAREITNSVRGTVVIGHLLDGMFGRIRTASASGLDHISGAIVDISDGNERQNKALWDHLRSLGYSVTVFGRCSNQICISWSDAG